MKMKRKPYNLFRFLADIFRYIPVQATVSAVYTIVLSLLPAFQTLAMGAFIDTAERVFAGERTYGAVLLPLACIGGSLVYQNVMPTINSLAAASGQNGLRTALRAKTVWKQASLKYHYMENQESRELIGRVCDEIDENFWKEYENLLQGVSLVIRTISLLLIVLQYTFWGGLLIIAVSAPLFLLAAHMGGKNYQMGKEAETVQRRFGYLEEVLTDRGYAQERTLFGYGAFVKEKYKGLFDRSFQMETRILKKQFLNMKSGSMMTILIGTAIMGILLPSLGKGGMSGGIYIALVSAVFGLVQTMSWQMAEAVLGLARLREYLREYQAFLDMEETEGAWAKPWKEPDFVFQTLEFRNVTFQYPGTQKYVLRDCSFLLTHGKTYAFVGVNGAGKTTIAKLISGLYEDYEGEILLNGTDIKKYSMERRKGIIGIAFQDFAKYALSVDQNVQLGNPGDCREEEIRKVLEEVGLTRTVENLKEGIYTKLGRLDEQSADFSGGQWQRLEIARLLYSQRPVSILDEPTAALDPMAEARIYELFQKVNRGRFVIYITHRLGAARIADEILVLGAGRIIEHGSHQELTAHSGGIYRKMYESQKSWYE